MKLWLVALGFCGVSVSAAAGADPRFSEAIRVDEFMAAGLAKLSPAEIARLDALVRDFKSGALKQSRPETVAIPLGAATVEAKAAVASLEKKKGEDRAMAAKAKVMLTPGTEVEYSTIESRIVGEFRGWEGRTVFNLENGQRWQAAGTDIYVAPAIIGPTVKITPGMLGTFWMTVEGVRRRVKGTLVGSAK